MAETRDRKSEVRDRQDYRAKTPSSLRVNIRRFTQTKNSKAHGAWRTAKGFVSRRFHRRDHKDRREGGLGIVFAQRRKGRQVRRGYSNRGSEEIMNYRRERGGRREGGLGIVFAHPSTSSGFRARSRERRKELALQGKENPKPVLDGSHCGRSD